MNTEEKRVQGFIYNSTGTSMVETLADIQIDQSNMVDPKVTESVDMVVNLDASETADTFDITDPGGSSQYSTALTIYDSLGKSHTITTYFTKTAAQAWQWNATVDGSDVVGGTAGTPVLFGTGNLAFDTSGALTTTMPVSFYTASGAGAVTFADGIAASAVDLDLTGTTQYGSASAIQSLIQDGYAAGMISGVTINTDGTIVGLLHERPGQEYRPARPGQLHEFERPGKMRVHALPVFAQFRRPPLQQARGGGNGHDLLGHAGRI